jgi:hypothetical protein
MLPCQALTSNPNTARKSKSKQQQQNRCDAISIYILMTFFLAEVENGNPTIHLKSQRTLNNQPEKEAQTLEYTHPDLRKLSRKSN